MKEERDEWTFKARVRVLSAKGKITKMDAIQAIRRMAKLYRCSKKARDHYVEVHELEDGHEAF